MEINQCRPEVQAFAIAMEEELRRNDWKGGWQLMNDFQLMGRLEEESLELKDVLRYNIGLTNQVLKESVDVANFAMMIADKFGGLNHA